ncbi:MAG: acylphosphatase [Phycisphaerales bacterium]
MRKQVRYTGRVQGVGFRATARQCAARLGATGWVRNEPDGSVLMEVQGTPETVDGVLVSILGAMGRNIAGADAIDLPDAPAAAETGFRIDRGLPEAWKSKRGPA